MIEHRNSRDPVAAIDRATAVAVVLYDSVAEMKVESIRGSVLLLLAHLREARKDQQ